MMNGGEIERWLDPDWRRRVRAWWEGYDLAALRAMARQRRTAVPPPNPPVPPIEATAVAAAAPVDGATKAALALLGATALEQERTGDGAWSTWSMDAIAGAECLWGDGRLGPSMDDALLDVAPSLGIGRGSDVLDTAAGLGGPARFLAAATGARVIGLEPDALLALLANKRADAAGMAARAPVFVYDPNQFTPPGVFDLVLADGMLRRVAEADLFIDGLRRATRRGGGVLLSDYVFRGRVPTAALRNWQHAEREPFSVLREEEVHRRLRARGLDVRGTHDATDLQRRRITAALRGLAARIATDDPGVPRSGLAAEIRMWGARLKALGEGVAFMRMLARPAG